MAQAADQIGSTEGIIKAIKAAERFAMGGRNGNSPGNRLTKELRIAKYVS